MAIYIYIYIYIYMYIYMSAPINVDARKVSIVTPCRWIRVAWVFC